MKINDDARLFIWWDAELTFDPATATAVELEVDGTRYPMTWTGDAVEVVAGKEWTRTARTEVSFIGTGRTATGTDVALGAGRHMAEPIVSAADGQVVPRTHPVTIDVA